MKRLALLLLLLLGSLSCARTVSTESSVLFLNIDISFRELTSLSDTIVVIPFRNSDGDISPKSGELSLDDYMIFPGKEFDDATLAGLNKEVVEYYDDFFSTWTNFLYINGSTVQFIRSNASTFNATTTDNLLYEPDLNFEYDLSIASDVLSLVIDIEQLGYSELDSIRFAVLIFDKESSSAAGTYTDGISKTNSLLLEKNNYDYETYPQTDEVDAHFDILEWSVLVR